MAADTYNYRISISHFPLMDKQAEYIATEQSDRDAWHCICGNTPSGDGFFPCDEKGNEMEPNIGSNWNGLYVCARCGRVIEQDTLKVIAEKSLAA